MAELLDGPPAGELLRPAIDRSWRAVTQEALEVDHAFAPTHRIGARGGRARPPYCDPARAPRPPPLANPPSIEAAATLRPGSAPRHPCAPAAFPRRFPTGTRRAGRPVAADPIAIGAQNRPMPLRQPGAPVHVQTTFGRTRDRAGEYHPVAGVAPERRSSPRPRIAGARQRRLPAATCSRGDQPGCGGRGGVVARRRSVHATRLESSHVESSCRDDQAARLESPEGGADRWSAGADESGRWPRVRAIWAQSDVTVGDRAPAVAEVPQQRDDALVGARELTDRLLERGPASACRCARTISAAAIDGRAPGHRSERLVEHGEVDGLCDVEAERSTASSRPGGSAGASRSPRPSSCVATRPPRTTSCTTRPSTTRHPRPHFVPCSLTQLLAAPLTSSAAS